MEGMTCSLHEHCVSRLHRAASALLLALAALLAIAPLAAVAADAVPKSLTLSRPDVLVAENRGFKTHTVQLSAAPSAAVTVAVSSSDSSAATVSPASLVFTTTTWSTAQTVTVTGVDDDAQNPGNERSGISINYLATSADQGYQGQSAAAAVRVIDDEIASVDGAVLSAVLLVEEVVTPQGYHGLGYSENSAQLGIFGVLTDDVLEGFGSGYRLVAAYEDRAFPDRLFVLFDDDDGSSGYSHHLP